MSLILKYDLGNPHRLPVGYTPLAYIESTGTQYIDTNITMNNTVKIYCKMQAITTGGLFYGTGNGGSTSLTAWAANSGMNWRYGGLAATPIPTIKSTEICEILHSSSSVSVNGTNFTYSGTPLFDSWHIYIFDSPNDSNTASAVRCYFFKIWKDNVLVADLIPAKNSSGVVGLFDCASQTFKTNAGTGAFIAGPEVVALPYEYLQVEYLESEDNVNCYINTSFIPDNNTRLVTSIYPTSTRTDAHFWFGSRNGSSSSQAFVFYQSGIATGSLNAAWNTSGNIGLSLSGQKWYDIDFNKNVLKVNGSTAYTFTSGTFTGAHPIFLFAMNTSGSMDGLKGGLKLGITKIYNNGTISRNMIPCYRRLDLKPGMYDIVNNVFYTNSGSGEFILGPVVEESSRQLEYNNAGSNYIGKPINIHHSTSNPSTTQINEGSGDFNNSVIVLNGGLPTTSKTICFWMYLASIPGTTIVYMDSNTGSCFSIDSQVNIGASTAKGSYNKSILKVGWQHITIDLLNWNLYVDGILLTKNSGSGYYNPTNGSNLNIGKRIYNGTYDYPFNGKMCDFRVYDNVLTADEVLKIYKGGV